MAFMQWSAALNRPTSDGSTERAHCEASARGKGKGRDAAIARLTPPPFPQALGHVWGWWAELNAARREGAYGIASITHADLYAWAQMTGREPTAHEVDMLLRLDGTYRVAVKPA